ncbi:MAG: Ribosomal RNA small subunit methyltransferase H [Parcubacteria group bacterium GW2011_GWE2_39_37]|nr:MAG: Ribosomal RNA small subunit methyltransferase H [Parcubacteria group bacterium GW2011_GWE2_39_37]
MLAEVLEYLRAEPGQNIIDCTMGGAGYTMAIAERINPGKVLAIDLDQLAIENAKKILAKNKIKNVIIVNDNFRNIKKIAEENMESAAENKFDGIVFDLGLSSAQLEDRTRGFSFKADAPLNMSFNQAGEISTEDIVNTWPEAELTRIIREYGEERFAHKIARKIIETRKTEEIKTTGQLIAIIKRSLPGFYLRKKGIHFATLTFQALRIATNEELVSLEEALANALKLLKKGGRIIVISYHSLEDRIVKQFFKKENIGCICPPRQPVCQCEHEASLKSVTRKVLIPTETEVEENPRARSAKMRVAEKL